VTPQVLLAAIGLEPDAQNAVIGEVARCRGNSWCAQALEQDDLLAIAAFAAWQVRQEQPHCGGGLIRLRVRWAVHEALRKEAYAHGFTKADRNRERHPRRERRCPCGKSLGTQALGGVRHCARCQIRDVANWSRRYRERRNARRQSLHSQEEAA